MDDLSICKRIAEIDNISARMMKSAFGMSLVYMPEGHGGYTPYNPLTDDALLWRLAKKYRVSITHWEQWQREQCKSEYDVIAHIEMGSGIWCASSVYFREGDESINKAICLAIIEAHKDE
jgi:hypothetical protein